MVRMKESPRGARSSLLTSMTPTIVVIFTTTTHLKLRLQDQTKGDYSRTPVTIVPDFKGPMLTSDDTISMIMHNS